MLSCNIIMVYLELKTETVLYVYVNQGQECQIATFGSMRPGALFLELVRNITNAHDSNSENAYTFLTRYS